MTHSNSFISPQTLIDILLTVQEERTFESARDIIYQAISAGELELTSRFTVTGGSMAVEEFIQREFAKSTDLDKLREEWLQKKQLSESMLALIPQA